MRSSFKGVTWHRHTKKYEAHIWCAHIAGATRKGKQFYLGAYAMETEAARAYDAARMKLDEETKCSHPLNFEDEDYHVVLAPVAGLGFLDYMQHVKKERRRRRIANRKRAGPQLAEEAPVLLYNDTMLDSHYRSGIMWRD